jgi:hypothetical protein
MFARFFLLGLICVATSAALGAERISKPLRNSPSSVSRAPSVSGDGRFVAFESTARITADDPSPRTDVYVYDRVEKTTRLVSDDRGGDQPVISANGRFVAYRSLEEGLTRIRVRDLERYGLPLTASYPTDVSNYDRTAELAAISPDGRYVAYIFRRAPNFESEYPLTVGNQIVVADIRDRSATMVKYRPENFPDNGTTIDHIGRMGFSADGKFVVFDTTVRLTPDDTNNASDVYRAAVNTINLQRLSKSLGTPDVGGATQPVMSRDGSTAFFLCENPLVATDTDGATSLYSSKFGTPIYHQTNSPPASLAAEATVSGRFLAYLTNKGRAFVRDLSNNVERSLLAQANAAIFTPILSGDDRQAVFATKASNLAPGDSASSFDVFAAPVPGESAERTPPAVTVTLSSGQALVEENAAITIGASASTDSGPVKLMTVEVDGREQFRTTAANLAPQAYVAPRGIHDVRARAFNDAWIEGKSELRPLIVVPAAGSLGITGTTSLERTDSPDGTARFNATLRIDNRRATATQPLQIVVTITSLPQKTAEFQGELNDVPNRGEFILTTLNLPSIASLGMITASFAGVTPAAEIVGDGYQGNGWAVRAQLREQNGPNFVNIESPKTVLTTSPRLDENTDLPNTGIPVTGPPNGSGFNSGLLQSVMINGPANVAEGGGAAFTALAIYSNGNQACSPEWSLTGANANRATIDASGRLTARSVDSPTNVTVRAAFSGAAATKVVTIKPTSPVLGITASDPAASESGDTGQVRIIRTKGNKEELTFNYTVTGKASGGADYALLTGTATFPPGASAVVVDIVPVQDATFEGTEDVLVTLEAGPGYRLKKNRSARVEISDDEPFPANQPDLTIRRGRGAAIGAFFVDRDVDFVLQTLSVEARRAKPTTFTISIINRGDTSRDYVMRGGTAATGFTVQYLDGKVDVTHAMIEGYFHVSQLAPGAAHEVTLIVTPTSETPIGGGLETVIQARADSFIDAVSTYVERVK